MSKNTAADGRTLYKTPFSRAYWRQAAAEFKSLRMLLFAALNIGLLERAYVIMRKRATAAE